MTTPTERMRALRWGWELLFAIEYEQQLDADLRSQARQMAKGYPHPENLLEALESIEPSLPATADAVINDSRRLFESVLAAPNAPPELRRHAKYTLRHFPSEHTWRAIRQAGSMEQLQEWLAPEA